MQKKPVLALIAGASLVGGELLHEAEEFDWRRAIAASSHNHVEIADDKVIDVTSPLTASGARSNQTRYYLHVVPAYINSSGCEVLVGYDAFGIPDSGDMQQMYRRFANIDEVMSTLESAWGVSPAQLEATRLSLVRGNRTEVGGHVARLVLPAASMRELGLEFRDRDI